MKGAEMDVIEQVKAQGERVTLPRRLVIEALGQAHDHLTISALQRHIQAEHPDQPMSDTTIYRVLQWLKTIGLVSQTDMGQAGTVYALIDRPQHHHLICLNCGGTITIDDAVFEALRATLSAQYHFMPRIDHMAIYGTCEQCADQTSAS